MPIIYADSLFMRESPWKLKILDPIPVYVYRYRIASGIVEAVSETPTQPSTQWEYTFNDGPPPSLSIVLGGERVLCLLSGERGQLAVRELR
jgi:hypothetical protein